MTVAAGGLLILCYHALSDEWPDELAVAPATLNRQIRSLLRRGYEPLTLSEALAAEGQGRRLVVSFDDAFESVLTRGLPVLERLGAPATVFVPTDLAAEGAPMTWSTLGRWVGTPHEAELRCLNWDGVRELVDAGWEVGSHSCSHPRLTRVDLDESAAEVVRSKQVCEAELGRPCPTFAYPFGDHDERVVAQVGEAGYSAAVTLGDRLLGRRQRTRPLELSRDGVYRSTRGPQLRLASSPLLGRLRTG